MSCDTIRNMQLKNIIQKLFYSLSISNIEASQSSIIHTNVSINHERKTLKDYLLIANFFKEILIKENVITKLRNHYLGNKTIYIDIYNAYDTQTYGYDSIYNRINYNAQEFKDIISFDAVQELTKLQQEYQKNNEIPEGNKKEQNQIIEINVEKMTNTIINNQLKMLSTVLSIKYFLIHLYFFHIKHSSINDLYMHKTVEFLDLIMIKDSFNIYNDKKQHECYAKIIEQYILNNKDYAQYIEQVFNLELVSITRDKEELVVNIKGPLLHVSDYSFLPALLFPSHSSDQIIKIINNLIDSDADFYYCNYHTKTKKILQNLSNINIKIHFNVYSYYRNTNIPEPLNCYTKLVDTMSYGKMNKKKYINNYKVLFQKKEDKLQYLIKEEKLQYLIRCSQYNNKKITILFNHIDQILECIPQVDEILLENFIQYTATSKEQRKHKNKYYTKEEYCKHKIEYCKREIEYYEQKIDSLDKICNDLHAKYPTITFLDYNRSDRCYILLTEAKHNNQGKNEIYFFNKN